MKNFKKLALVAMLALVASVAQAATIDTETDADTTTNGVDLEVLIAADLVESYKVTIENDDLVGGVGVAEGAINLTPASLNGAHSFASTNECRDSANTLIAYAGPDNACTFVDGSNIATSYADFTVLLNYSVELAGPGSIDLIASLAGNLASDSAFQASAVSPNIAVTGLVDASTGTLTWTGQMHMDEGPTFEETVLVDITKQP